MTFGGGCSAILPVRRAATESGLERPNRSNATRRSTPRNEKLTDHRPKEALQGTPRFDEGPDERALDV